MNSAMADNYLAFVNERHRIWESRQAGKPQPWTDDPVLASKKFTNVYRALDAGSQFLLKNLLGGDYGDTIMRCFMYRYTNRPEPWCAFHRAHGRWPTRADLRDGTLRNTWYSYQAGGGRVFGQAYKMFSGAENAGMSRLDWVLAMSGRYLAGTDSIVPRLTIATTVADRVAVLQTVPRCAGFMSMQIATDIGYSVYARADENSYIVPGPGARIGAAALDLSGEAAIMWAHERLQGDGPRLLAPSGQYRTPSLMDVQNTFCEFGKYVRYTKKGTADRPYSPAHPGVQSPVTLPAHW